MYVENNKNAEVKMFLFWTGEVMQQQQEQQQPFMVLWGCGDKQ